MQRYNGDAFRSLAAAIAIVVAMPNDANAEPHPSKYNAAAI